MVGLFDSGRGGLNTVRYVKEHHPSVDLVYFIDRERAPYGIKTQNELVRITGENVKLLTEMGAQRVLIACCTASTVYHMLPSELRAVSLPIIDAVAENAKSSTRIGRIGVIATSHTVRSHAFKNALSGYYVHEIALQELVALIDGGTCDKTIDDGGIAVLEHMLSPIIEAGCDTLILGCTHFPALIKTIENITRPHGIRALIDSARIGADLIAGEDKKLKQ